MGEFVQRSGRRRLEALVRRLALVGTLPSDSKDLRLNKAVLTLSASLIAVLASVWVASYAVLGLWWAALIPFAYQVASVSSIVIFARTKRYRLFRFTQLSMLLMLPFIVQWSLGGFEPSGAVALWAFAAPMGALLFHGARQALPWYAAFVVLTAFSGAIDGQLARADIPEGVVVTFFVLNLVGVGTTVFVLLQYFVRAREHAYAELELEQAKSEQLLLNVLPAPIAHRLKESAGVIADGLSEVTVLFADLAGFTPLADRLAPADAVALLNRIFSEWDALADRHGLEKIKTIGDAYMVAGGLPLPRADHVEATAEMALDMRAVVASDPGNPLTVRIGIHTGSVVAGVIGRSKFSYDLWGDTVNTASRMESHGLPDSIQVTSAVHEHLSDSYELRSRGTIEVKGKGPMTTYLLIGRRNTS